MSPFTSPAPWSVNANGGARTIVARDRSVVAVIIGSNGAAPFEVGNGALMAAAPDLRDALRPFAEQDIAEDSMCHRGLVTMDMCVRCKPILVARAALAKSEQDGGAPADGPVETGAGV